MLSFGLTRHERGRTRRGELAADGRSIGTATTSCRDGDEGVVTFQCGGTFGAELGSGTYSGAGTVTFSRATGVGAVTGSLILSCAHSALVTTIAAGSVVAPTADPERFAVMLVLEVTGGSHRFRNVGGTITLDGIACGPTGGTYAVHAELAGTVTHHRH